MRISIVVPTKNSGTVLRRALDSLLSQDVAPEIIIADGASTDESAGIIGEYAPRVARVLPGPDRSHFDAMNKGFAVASGDLFGWLSADDELAPGALATALREFEADPEIDVVTGACERIYADGERAIVNPPADPWEFVTRKNMIEQPATIFKADLYRRIGPLSEAFGASGDWEYWCRMRAAGARIRSTNALMARYHFSADNITSKLGNVFPREAEAIIRKYDPHGARYGAVWPRMYKWFDLTGAMDVPPTASLPLRAANAAAWLGLRALYGERIMTDYNWHFASLQARGLKWW